ncbi:hypothetical protein J7K27_10805, partial [Candidatus Bathyarchaeota archaeon]|nr:hypothetical protein [Candidatus Bathyarchaeota archaeon]
NGGWQVIKVHEYGWESKSRAHILEPRLQAFFRSYSYTYFLIRPVFMLRERNLVTKELDIIYDVCDYPIPPNLVVGLAETLNLGCFIWYVRRGINTVLFCKYISTWDEEIVSKIVLKLIVNSLTK